MATGNRTYMCIDMKSFYASVECAERGLNPFETNLVVADESRGKGALETGYGIKELPFGEMPDFVAQNIATLNPKQIWPWRFRITTNRASDILVVWCGDVTGERAGKIYLVHTLINYIADLGVTALDCDVTAMQYRYAGQNGMLIIKSTGGLYRLTIRSCNYYADTPALISACRHYSRVFGIENSTDWNRVFFSSAEDPAEWGTESGGGYLVVTDEDWGLPQVVKSFKDYVYIFAQHGIYRLTAYADEREFKLSPVTSFSGNLYEKTVQVCGDKIAFMTTEALYVFDGFGVTRVHRDAVKAIESADDAAVGFFNDRYYLACKIKTDGETLHDEEWNGAVNNGVVVFNLEGKQVDIMRGMDIKQFYQFDFLGPCKLMTLLRRYPTIAAYVEPKYGKYFQLPLKKRWTTATTDLLSADCMKKLRRLNVYAPRDVTIKLTADGETFIYVVNGASRTRTVYINKAFRNFSLAFESTADDISVLAFSLDVEFVRRYGDGL